MRRSFVTLAVVRSWRRWALVWYFISPVVVGALRPMSVRESLPQPSRPIVRFYERKLLGYARTSYRPPLHTSRARMAVTRAYQCSGDTWVAPSRESRSYPNGVSASESPFMGDGHQFRLVTPMLV